VSKRAVFHNFFHRCGKLWEETPTGGFISRPDAQETDRRIYHTLPTGNQRRTPSALAQLTGKSGVRYYL